VARGEGALHDVGLARPPPRRLAERTIAAWPPSALGAQRHLFG
jgi:hypothetical protein